jgi:hypothetical protein
MSQLVKLESIAGNNVVATTSLKIAEVFEKNHFDVIKLIEIEINKGLFGARNFSVSSYKSEQNKEIKMYLLDERFTTFLTMGFTGDRADQWKLQYIDAFNAMKDEIHKKKELTTGGVFKDFHSIAEVLGLSKEQAAIHANHATRKKTGDDVLALMEYKVITGTRYQSLTKWLEGAGISAVKGNKVLSDKGYLVKDLSNQWTLTKLGETIGHLVTQEAGGKMRQSIEWSEEVVNVILGGK